MFYTGPKYKSERLVASQLHFSNCMTLFNPYSDQLCKAVGKPMHIRPETREHQCSDGMVRMLIAPDRKPANVQATNMWASCLSATLFSCSLKFHLVRSTLHTRPIAKANTNLTWLSYAYKLSVAKGQSTA